MLLDRQEVKKATEMFEKALELCPGNGTPWVHKGYVAVGCDASRYASILGNLQYSNRQTLCYIVNHHNHSSCVCSLMLIQFGEDLNGGTAMIEKALEVDPKCEFAYETLAAFEIQKLVNWTHCVINVTLRW